MRSVGKGAMDCKLQLAVKQLKLLSRDRTSKCITPRLKWRMAYWAARQEIANAAPKR